MTDVRRWRLGILLLSSMASAAIASADRMNFPTDPKAYEPPTKARSGPITDPFAPNAASEEQQGLRHADRPTVISPILEMPDTSGADAPSVQLPAPWVEEKPQPVTPNDNRSVPPSKRPDEVSPPSKRFVKAQSHDRSPTPPKTVIAVGIVGGIVLFGFLIHRLSEYKRRREKPMPREPVLLTGVGGASIAEIVGPPEYLRFFGLDSMACEEDVLRAYRERSWAVHPDHGGDAAAFKDMQRRFEQSLAFVRRRRRTVSLP